MHGAQTSAETIGFLRKATMFDVCLITCQFSVFVG